MCVDIADSNGVNWVPDHAVNHCRLCGAEFWLGRRKHHCRYKGSECVCVCFNTLLFARSCGGIFCWQCSNYFTPVPHEQLFKDQRVCKTCYDKLGGYSKSCHPLVPPVVISSGKVK